jgi:hypothetical protein
LKNQELLAISWGCIFFTFIINNSTNGTNYTIYSLLFFLKIYLAHYILPDYKFFQICLMKGDTFYKHVFVAQCNTYMHFLKLLTLRSLSCRECAEITIITFSYNMHFLKFSLKTSNVIYSKITNFLLLFIFYEIFQSFILFEKYKYTLTKQFKNKMYPPFVSYAIYTKNILLNFEVYSITFVV